MAEYPILEFDWKDLPNVVDNIWQAQMAGWERVLTYRGPLPDPRSRGIRKHTMAYENQGATYRIPHIKRENDLGEKETMHRDEYPFACTVEGSSEDGRRKIWVGHVPAKENLKQGGMLSAFIQEHGITATGPNRQFEVRVINHPRGPVLP